MAVFTGRCVGNIDVDVLDLGIEQLALAGQDAHAALLDKHFAIDLAHMRPTRLEGQFGVMHLEEQADVARSGQRVMVERTLVLEEPLVHGAFKNCGAQPFIQGRAQHGRQILGRETTIAIDHTDPQVHVVFLGMVEVQANQEVGSHFALLAQHLDVRGNQGEAFFIQLPCQARVGLDVLPGLGEDRVQVQGKILAVHTQLTLAQIATDTPGYVPCGWRTEVRVKTDAFKVGGEAEFFIGGVLRMEIHQHIAQHARGLEVLDGFGKTFRQWRQGIQQRGNRGQVKAVSLKLPGFLVFVGRHALLQLQV